MNKFIKQKSKEKGRKLKVVCDWDYCLQPVKPSVISRLNPSLIIKLYLK